MNGGEYMNIQEAIKSSGVKKVFIAEKLGLSPSGLYLKLKNPRNLTVQEIEILSQAIHIDRVKLTEICRKG